jgi:hypothetical protein
MLISGLLFRFFFESKEAAANYQRQIYVSAWIRITLEHMRPSAVRLAEKMARRLA